LKLVIQNLLENAWKFSSTRQRACIDMGILAQETSERENKAGESTVYFIRDNGVGFDMAYAEKLFAPFQRLHSMEEFPGTGIGLAIVKRIITRHGGHIWPSAKLDHGATFYFTLGEG
jgi:light-regulated signal transduction histidine kinase (bacteriophytochrome)